MNVSSLLNRRNFILNKIIKQLSIGQRKVFTKLRKQNYDSSFKLPGTGCLSYFYVWSTLEVSVYK